MPNPARLPSLLSPRPKFGLILGLLVGTVGCTTTHLAMGPPKVLPGVKTTTSIGDHPVSVIAGVTGESYGRENEILDLPDRAEGRISGQVVDERGRPVPEAEIRLADDGRPFGRDRQARTDAAGRFTLRDLRPGSRYTLIAGEGSNRPSRFGRAVARAPEGDVIIQLGRGEEIADVGPEPIREPVQERIDRVSKRRQEPLFVPDSPAARINPDDLPPAPEAATLASRSLSRGILAESQVKARPSGWQPAGPDGLEPLGVSSEPEPDASSDRRSALGLPLEWDDGPNPLPPAIEPEPAAVPNDPPGFHDGEPVPPDGPTETRLDFPEPSALSIPPTGRLSRLEEPPDELPPPRRPSPSPSRPIDPDPLPSDSSPSDLPGFPEPSAPLSAPQPEPSTGFGSAPLMAPGSESPEPPGAMTPAPTVDQPVEPRPVRSDPELATTITDPSSSDPAPSEPEAPIGLPAQVPPLDDGPPPTPGLEPGRAETPAPPGLAEPLAAPEPSPAIPAEPASAETSNPPIALPPKSIDPPQPASSADSAEMPVASEETGSGATEEFVAGPSPITEAPDKAEAPTLENSQAIEAPASESEHPTGSFESPRVEPTVGTPPNLVAELPRVQRPTWRDLTAQGSLRRAYQYPLSMRRTGGEPVRPGSEDVRKTFFGLPLRVGNRAVSATTPTGSIVPVACQFDERRNRLVDFTLPDVQGRAVHFRDLDADYILLDFWGTWCAPCIKAVPHLVQLQNRYDSRRLRVVGIAYEQAEPGQAVDLLEGAMRDLGVNYPILMGENDGQPCPLAKALKIQAYPTLVLLDRHGRILWRDTGAGPLTLARLDRVVAANARGQASILRR